MNEFDPKSEQVHTLYEILSEIRAVCEVGEQAIESSQAQMLLSGIGRLTKAGTSAVGNLERILMDEGRKERQEEAAA